MAKQREVTLAELTELILSLPFEGKVTMFETLKADILTEGKARSAAGEFADKVIKSIDAGKHS